MAGTFAFVDAVTANTRQTDDALNGVAGGCAAGFLAGVRGKLKAYIYSYKTSLFSLILTSTRLDPTPLCFSCCTSMVYSRFTIELLWNTSLLAYVSFVFALSTKSPPHLPTRPFNTLQPAPSQ